MKIKETNIEVHNIAIQLYKEGKTVRDVTCNARKSHPTIGCINKICKDDNGTI